jgi:DNA-binding NarL/FixJ family response regulator
MNHLNYTIASKLLVSSHPYEVAGMIKLLIVDDQPSVRTGLRMRLAAEPDFTVVGEAADGEVALDLARTLSPDVVLMDVEMPHMGGIAATDTLHQMYPSMAVIMLSIHDDAQTRARAEKAGAVGFVPKSVPTEMLLATIRQAVTR